MQNHVSAIITSLLILICTCPAQMQPSCPDSGGKSEDTTNHSIQFYLINGVSVAYRHKLSQGNALRILCDLSATLYGRDEEMTTRNKDYEQNNTLDSKTYRSQDSQQIDVSLQYLLNMHTSKFIEFYLGAGVIFEYNRTSGYNEYYDYVNNQPEYKAYNETINREYGVGITGIIGLECLIMNHLSLFCEYLPHYVYGWLDYTSDATNYYNERSGTYWRFSVNKLKVGISVNF